MEIRRIFIDSNAIIEAHRTRCWNVITGHHRIETVGKCVEECGTGEQDRDGYVKIDVEALRERIPILEVQIGEIIALELRLENLAGLDPGEKHLLAFAVTQQDAWWVCSPDNVCIRAAVILGIQDNLISLERIAEESGVNISFRDQYTKKWLRKKRSEILFEEI